MELDQEGVVAGGKPPRSSSTGSGPNMPPIPLLAWIWGFIMAKVLPTWPCYLSIGKLRKYNETYLGLGFTQDAHNNLQSQVLH